MPGAAEDMDTGGGGAVALVPGQAAKAVGGGGGRGRAPPPPVDLVDSHTRALGVIQPPPDIRAIVDKTAQFVARNGEGGGGRGKERRKKKRGRRPIFRSRLPTSSTSIPSRRLP